METLREMSDGMFDIAAEIEEKIISYMKANGVEFLDLQKQHIEDGEDIMALVFMGDGYGNIEERERQIVALHYAKSDTNDRDFLYILHQPDYNPSRIYVEWTMDDIIKLWEDEDYDGEDSGIWDGLMFSDIHAAHTAYNLADGLKNYKQFK